MIKVFISRVEKYYNLIMSDLLQVIIDFNIDKLTQSANNQEPAQNGMEAEEGPTPLQMLFDSLIKFLNAFQLQSALNKYRIYLALPKYQSKNGKAKGAACRLIFPRVSDHEALLERFAFQQVRDVIYQQIEEIISEELMKIAQDTEQSENLNGHAESDLANQIFSGPQQSEPQISSSTALSQAFLKAICFAKQHQKSNPQPVKQMGDLETQSSRILVVQLDKDDPNQYSEMVNGIFAAQKLKVTIDTLLLAKERSEKEKESYLMIQACQQTNGVFREIPEKWTSASSSKILFELMTNFLPSPAYSRQVLRVPTAQQLDSVKMYSTCVQTKQEVNIGYACANCLALHCLQPVITQLKEIDAGKNNAVKAFKSLSTLERKSTSLDAFQQNWYKNKTEPNLVQHQVEKGITQCFNCKKTFMK